MDTIHIYTCEHTCTHCPQSIGLTVGIVTCFRRGSPLVIGVKSPTKLATDRFPVLFSKGISQFLTENITFESFVKCAQLMLHIDKYFEIKAF